MLLLGATIGVIALAGWRPGRSWYLLSVGLSIWVIADAVYSVQRADGTYTPGVYDYLWPAGLLLMAFAAWQPRGVHSPRELYGWKAVILAGLPTLRAGYPDLGARRHIWRKRTDHDYRRPYGRNRPTLCRPAASARSALDRLDPGGWRYKRLRGRYRRGPRWRWIPAGRAGYGGAVIIDRCCGGSLDGTIGYIDSWPG